MRSVCVIFGEHVEEEGLDVVVERLVVEKEFGEQTEILAVDSRHIPVHFPHRQRVLSVNLRRRWPLPSALILKVLTNLFRSQ